MEENKLAMPAVALRGITILPGMIAHFDIGRGRSVRAVEKAMNTDERIFIVTQKDNDQENPDISHLYDMGTIAQIRQVAKLQRGIVRILVEGMTRARLCEYEYEGEKGFPLAHVVPAGTTRRWIWNRSQSGRWLWM